MGLGSQLGMRGSLAGVPWHRLTGLQHRFLRAGERGVSGAFLECCERSSKIAHDLPLLLPRHP
jgi:hypothetical protein